MSNTELFPHGRWLLCRPDDYDIRYQINPWMDVRRGAEQEKAKSQWQRLHHTLIRCGAWVECIPQGANVPDMVFTANGGLIKGNVAVVPRFRHKERQPEEALFKKWFSDHGFTVCEVTKGHFEGEGDALFAGETLFAGVGFRSDREAYDEIKKHLSVKDLVITELIDARFYHLDTCFTPLSEKLVMLFPKAISPASLAEIRARVEVIEVPEEDAVKFVCNTVVLGNTLIMPAGCESTAKVLRARGFTLHFVEMDEYLKAGGAAKCLSLRLQN